MSSINTIQGKLKEVLAALLETSQVRKVYGYRTMPLRLAVEMSISYQGGQPQFGVFGNSEQDGDDNFCDFALSVTVKHDSSELSLEAAEQSLNSIEQLVFDSVVGSSEDGYWYEITAPRPSMRPPSPTTAIEYRHGVIFLRTHF